MDMPKSEVVYLPCRDCGLPLPVNTVYVPYLNGKSSCVPHRCQKNDRNVWSLLLNENDSQYPHRGHLIHCPARFARSVHPVLSWFIRTNTPKRSERSERSGTNTYQHVQNICSLVLRTRYPVTTWLVAQHRLWTVWYRAILCTWLREGNDPPPTKTTRESGTLNHH